MARMLQWIVVLLLLVLPLSAGSDQLKFQFSADRDKDKEEVTDSKYGSGEEESYSYRYRLLIENAGSEPVEGIEARLHVVAAPFDWKKDTPLKVFNTQVKKDIKMDGYGKLTIDFEPVVFKQSLTRQGGTFWKSGNEYSGYVLEALSGGQIVFTDSKGGSDVKKAVKVHIESAEKIKP